MEGFRTMGCDTLCYEDCGIATHGVSYFFAQMTIYGKNNKCGLKGEKQLRRLALAASRGVSSKWY
jgi:hypothetical protein